MRGKVHNAARAAPIRGITPAYAGKRLLRQLRHITSRDHPRVCGEKAQTSGCSLCGAGSPPRMRGKAIRGAALAASERITPAYAGKSSLGCEYCIVTQDHPRVCGEKAQTSGCSLCGAGSPPRMRGKAIRGAALAASERITPAYAGKSSLGCEYCIVTQDHPRVCGEKA